MKTIMKKFITMKGNPAFKKDLIVCDIGKEKATHVSFNHLTNKVEINGYQLEVWIKEGWIREVEGKEYIYSDMKRCGEFWAGGPITKEHFDHWLKQR